MAQLLLSSFCGIITLPTRPCHLAP